MGLIIWDVRKGEMLCKINKEIAKGKSHTEARGNYSSCVSFSPNGSNFATGTSDKAVLLWNINLRSFLGGDDSDNRANGSKIDDCLTTKRCPSSSNSSNTAHTKNRQNGNANKRGNDVDNVGITAMEEDLEKSLSPCSGFPQNNLQREEKRQPNSFHRG
eukprot:2713760-Ditylum_brightwellii.AAC.1